MVLVVDRRPVVFSFLHYKGKLKKWYGYLSYVRGSLLDQFYISYKIGEYDIQTTRIYIRTYKTLQIVLLITSTL